MRSPKSGRIRHHCTGSPDFHVRNTSRVWGGRRTLPLMGPDRSRLQPATAPDAVGIAGEGCAPMPVAIQLQPFDPMDLNFVDAEVRRWASVGCVAVVRLRRQVLAPAVASKTPPGGGTGVVFLQHCRAAVDPELQRVLVEAPCDARVSRQLPTLGGRVSCMEFEHRALPGGCAQYDRARFWPRARVRGQHTETQRRIAIIDGAFKRAPELRQD